MNMVQASAGTIQCSEPCHEAVEGSDELIYGYDGIPICKISCLFSQCVSVWTSDQLIGY